MCSLGLVFIPAHKKLLYGFREILEVWVRRTQTPSGCYCLVELSVDNFVTVVPFVLLRRDATEVRTNFFLEFTDGLDFTRDTVSSELDEGVVVCGGLSSWSFTNGLVSSREFIFHLLGSVLNLTCPSSGFVYSDWDFDVPVNRPTK